jgi:alpha/beta superfamily hydrolase
VSPVSQTLHIPGPAGSLESLVEVPAGVAAPAAFAVICHPHPLHRGTMHNKVVHTLARACLELGIPTIRFNYRGVGASVGGYAEGIGETADALAVVGAGRERWPDAELVLAGFSFGGVVALRAAGAVAARRLVTVAPAVDRVPLDVLPTLPRAWLLVQGMDDEVVPQPHVQAWAEALRSPPQCVWLPGVGHYFHGALNPLKAAVQEFMRK